jgi:hypothetical protein
MVQVAFILPTIRIATEGFPPSVCAADRGTHPEIPRRGYAGETLSAVDGSGNLEVIGMFFQFLDR